MFLFIFLLGKVFVFMLPPDFDGQCQILRYHLLICCFVLKNYKHKKGNRSLVTDGHYRGSKLDIGFVDGQDWLIFFTVVVWRTAIPTL